MKMNDDKLLEQLFVKSKDRNYQIWERNSLSIDLFTEQVFLQNLSIFTTTLFKMAMANFPEQYKFSSAKFYEAGVDEFNFLAHFRE
jgi:hypothetical protein